MKRFISAVSTVSVVVGIIMLTGCGGDENSSATSVESTPQIDSNALAKAKGKAIFKKTCIACHGEGGKGIEGLGKDWTTSEFIANSSDDELVAFIKAGRTIDDPMSAGNAPMPPYGGDPTLNDEDLHNVVLFMRSIHE